MAITIKAHNGQVDAMRALLQKAHADGYAYRGFPTEGEMAQFAKTPEAREVYALGFREGEKAHRFDNLRRG